MKRKLLIAGLIIAAVAAAGYLAYAALTKTWNFTTTAYTLYKGGGVAEPGTTEAGNAEIYIDTAAGLAKLKQLTASYNDDTKAEYDAGTHSSTEAVNAVNYIRLKKTPNGGYYTSGDYTSGAKSSGGNAWETISWPATTTIAIAAGINPNNESGLVGLWHMNEASWNGTANEVVDSSGSGNHGVRAGNATTTTSAKLGAYAGTFDGSGDYVDIANESSFDQTDYLTVEGWVYLSDSSRSTMVAKGTGASANGGWSWDYGGFNAGQITFGVTGGSGIYISVGAPMSTGTWHHVAGVFDKDLSGNSRSKLYIDGVYQSGATYVTAGAFTTILANNEIVRIGARPSTGSIPFTGLIDEVAIYNRALDPSEILAHYNMEGSAEFRIRSGGSAADAGTKTFVGPTGTEDYYTVSGTSLTDKAVSDGAGGYYFNPTDEWLQYRAYFGSFRNTAGRLDSLTLSHAGGAVSDDFTTASGKDTAAGTYSNTEWEGDYVKLWRSALGDGSDGALTVTSAGTVVNAYASIADAETSLSAATINVRSGEGGSFSAGDEILVIQMQGASNAGVYEFAEVSSVSGDAVVLTSNLNNIYYSNAFNQFGASVAQIVRVPQYTTVTVNSSPASITADAYNGYKGGIVVFRATGAVSVNGSIDVSGKGYRGGVGNNGVPGSGSADRQGESYQGLGGYGNSNNLGGGGGAQIINNAGSGGGGGYGSAGTQGLISFGYGGTVYGSSVLQNIFPGSGGGGISYEGGGGGGIIVIIAENITVNGDIKSNGSDGSVYADYGSGGGSGGSVSLNANDLNLGLNKVAATGGLGGDVATYDGGDGGNGRIRLNYNTLAGTTDPAVGYEGSFTDAPESKTLPLGPGTYTSPVIDAGQIVNWGAFNWGEEYGYGDELVRDAVSDGGWESSRTLVGLWHLNEASGLILDSSGSGNLGTYNGILYNQSAKFSGGLGFDGANDFVDIGAGPASVKTVEFWVNPATTTEYFINLTGTSDYIWANAGTVTAAGFGGTIYVNGFVSSVITAGVWQHIAVVTDAAKNAGNLDFGRTQNVNYLDGTLDEVALWNRALSAEEIIDHYRRGINGLTMEYDLSGSGSWTTVASPNDAWSTVTGTSFQYRAALSTENTGYTPKIKVVTTDLNYYSANNPYVIPNSGQTYYGVLTGFSQSLAGASVTYQISNNGTTWYWWDGGAWDSQVTGQLTSNSYSVINANIGAFKSQIGLGNFYFKAFLVSDGTQPVELDSVTLNYAEAGITVSLPDAATTWATGASGTINWTKAGGTASDTWNFYYSTTGATTKDDASWTLITTGGAQTVTDSGSGYSWTWSIVGNIVGTQTRIKAVDAVYGDVWDINPADFEVQAGGPDVFDLTTPADITAGERAAYTVTRYDQFSNENRGNALAVYLYAGPAGQGSAFYDAASGGNVIDNAVNPLTIAQGVSTANFWYYEEKIGTYTVTVSDNSSAPDGNTGIDDATDSLGVNLAALDHLEITGTGTMNAGGGQTITITAMDVYRNVITGYTGAKTLTFSGPGSSPNPATAPTVDATNFGAGTSVTFTNGSATAAMSLYNAETVSVDVSDGTYNSTGSTAYDLDLVVSPINKNKLLWVTQPSSPVTAGAVWTGFGVEITDQYGNRRTAADGATDSVTLTPSAGSFASGTNPLSATAGLATFSDLTYNAARNTPGITLTASSGALISTAASSAVVIRHAAADHLKFSNGITTPQAVSVAFDLPTITAVDAYDNTADGADGAAAYSGAKTLSYSLSGTADAPDGNGSDVWDTAVIFTAGVSDVPTNNILYRAQGTTVEPVDGALARAANQPSNSITINPDTAVKLDFKQEPSSTGTINVVLTQQPIVSIEDTYGNQTAGTDSITLYDSTSGSSYSDGPGTLAATVNPLAAIAGQADFGGVTYDATGAIYVYAQSGALVPAFSAAITFSTTSTSTVEAPTVQVSNFSLTPTNDTLAEKFEALKFKVQDAGADLTATLIDRIRVSIGGTGANASTDIAWAELEAGGAQVATAASITDSLITFGSAPDGQSDADLYSLSDNSSTEFTVYIYMNSSKLSAVEGDTYTFDIDESGINADTGTSSQMTADSGTITAVTGAIVIVADYLEVVEAAGGTASVTVTAGATEELTVRATDANKNIDQNYSGNHTLNFSGLSNSPNGDQPKIETTALGYNITVNFSGGVSAANAGTLTAYNAETEALTAAESGQAYSAHTLAVTVTATTADNIALDSGNNQTGVISNALANPLVVIVKDTYGNVVSGTNVTFATSGGASVSPASAATNSSGQAQTTLTFGSSGGVYNVEVSSAGLTGSPVTFSATALAPTALDIVSGNNQSNGVTLALASALVVKLRDVTDTAIPGETVSFEIISYPAGAAGQSLDGSGSTSSDTTDSSGQASTALTLGDKIGTYTVRASSNGFTADFTATATAGAPYQVVLTGPASVDTDSVSTAWTIELQDSYNNATNATVDTVFSLSSTSGAGTFYSDSNGTNAITGRTVPSGASSNTFYYKDTVTGAPTVTGTRASGETLTTGADSASINVTPGNLSYFTVTGSAAAMTTGGSRAITVTAYDAEGNVQTDVSDMNIVFSGAISSPSPSSAAATATNSSSADINFGSNTMLDFTTNPGIATATLKLYKAETVAIKAASGAATTSAANDLDIVVKHGAADHLKFAANLPTPQTAGSAFNFETTLDVVDLYDNIADGANGAAAYNESSKTVTWTLSGTADGPDSGTDTYTNPVSFTNGRSTTTLSATLYYAQSTTITASVVGLSGTNAASNSITVNAGAVNKLSWNQQPSTSANTNVVLAQQPIVAVADTYGNPITSASDQITLTGSTTTGSYTAVTNGALSADTNPVTLSNGLAAFSGVKYSYPEAIYLRAAAVTASVSDIYSYRITFSVESTDGSIAAGPLSEPATISSTAYTDSAKVQVFDWTATDAGADGYGLKIKQIVITRNTTAGTTDTTGGWLNYVGGATISDGATAIMGTVTDNALTFGAGTGVIYTVADAGNKTFTLSLYLKQSLPAGADGKIIAFDIDPNDDISVDTVSSGFAAAGSLTSSSSVDVAASKFLVTGSVSTVAAGVASTVTIKAADVNSNIDTDYAGSKQVIFSGASTAASGDVPDATNSAAVYTDFGSVTLVNFTSGQSSSTITMKLYKAEGAAIKAADNQDATITTSAADDLEIVVTGGSASQLAWGTQPKTSVVANAPWNTFTVNVTDAYQNVSSSSIDVTVTPSGASWSGGSTYIATAAAGVATFNSFAVYAGSYPATVTLNATASGVTQSGASDTVTLSEKYTVNIKVLDSVNGSALTDLTLKILDAGTGGTVAITGFANPMTGNSPFSAIPLPYDTYQFNLNKDAYVETTVEKAVSTSADSADGAYDNDITWTIYVTSVAESLADYKVLGSFVYDENLDTLYVNTRLEKRGQQIVTDVVNTLQAATLNIYDSSNVASTVYSSSLATPNSEGNYWFTISNATASQGFAAGKSYFAKMTILYGSSTGSVNYSAVNTFDIGVAARLKTWTQEIKAEVAGVKSSVSTEAATTRSKISEVKSSVTDIKTDVAGVKTETAGILTATGTDPLADKITTARTELEKRIDARILNRATTVKSGDTMVMRYRTETGLAPTVTVYDPANVIKVSAAVMTELGSTGIYQYALKFDTSWGKGDFVVYSAESSRSTSDSITISVVGTDLDDISGDVSAVLGATAGVSGLDDTVDTLTTQLDVVGAGISKISELISGEGLGSLTADLAEDLSVVFSNLTAISNQIKDLGGTQGYGLDELYEVSTEKADDITYLKNKSAELKALVEMNRNLIDNVAQAPVVQTWYEFHSVMLKMVAINPSQTETRRIPFKAYLPREARPEHIMEKGDLELFYDTQKAQYYVYQEYELGPKETITREIELEDIWQIDQYEIESLREEAIKLAKALENTDYYTRAEFLKNTIESRLDTVTRRQGKPALTPAEHISDYRENVKLIEAIEGDLITFERLISQARRVSPQTSWRMIVIIAGFLGALSLAYFFVWQRQLKAVPTYPSFEDEKSVETGSLGAEKRDAGEEHKVEAKDIEDILKKKE